MKIVILERDSLGIDVDMSEIDGLGEVTVYPATTVETAAAHIGDADIIIANKLPLNEQTLKEAKNLKFVAQSSSHQPHALHGRLQTQHQMKLVHLLKLHT